MGTKWDWTKVIARKDFDNDFDYMDKLTDMFEFTAKVTNSGGKSKHEMPNGYWSYHVFYVKYRKDGVFN